jgi:hypothetical protein
MHVLEKMLKKLLEDARKLPPGQNRHELLKGIGRFGVKIAAIQKRKDGSSKAIAGKADRERDISRPRQLTDVKAD